MRTRRLTAQTPGNLASANMRAPSVAGFPRVPAGASALVVQPGAGLPPVAAFDPPIAQGVPHTPPLPATGLTGDIEAKTLELPWPAQGGILSSDEVAVYQTRGQWSALDVYIQDANLIGSNMVITIRVFALAAQGAPTLVASGRFGLFSQAAAGAAEAATAPLWVAAARSQASNFLVTFQIEKLSILALPPATGQTSSITVVASNRSDDAPPMIGACTWQPTAQLGTALNSALDAELLMVSGAIGAAVAAPRYLHLHTRAGAIATFAPVFSFPLGAGVAAAGGGTFGGPIWFPPGFRPYGATRTWQMAPSSTANVTTVVADVVLQGLYR